MKALFVSSYCENCDGEPPSDLYRGFIVFRGETGEGAEEYVFPDRGNAELWRDHGGYPPGSIREVLCHSQFQWHQSRGSLSQLQLANRRYEIFPDHRFEPRPNRAFLA